MIPIVGKSLKLFLFGFISLFLFSSGSKPTVDYPALNSGSYQFNVTGEYNLKIEGLATFQHSAEEDKLGYRHNKLMLNFVPNGELNCKQLNLFSLRMKC